MSICCLFSFDWFDLLTTAYLFIFLHFICTVNRDTSNDRYIRHRTINYNSILFSISSFFFSFRECMRHVYFSRRPTITAVHSILHCIRYAGEVEHWSVHFIDIDEVLNKSTRHNISNTNNHKPNELTSTFIFHVKIFTSLFVDLFKMCVWDSTVYNESFELSMDLNFFFLFFGTNWSNTNVFFHIVKLWI